ncbi:MAG TPA: hypothetical protein PLF86_03820, partial [Candidatus Moranbacteria bacterium]|nr:hypothetical protein [Candidatus Moranbacteria bacterium]
PVPKITEIKKEEPSEYLNDSIKTEKGIQEPESTTADSGEVKATMDSHDAIFKKLRDGNATPQEVKDAYRSLVNSKDEIIKELSSMTKDAILKRMGGMRQYRYKNDKKDTIIKAAYEDMISDFALGNGISYSPFKEKYEDVMNRMVEKYTEADLEEYKKRVDQAREDYKKRVEGFKKALTNPETLDEFQTFIKSNGKDKLSPEQLRQYDELVANKVREGNKADQERKAIVRAAGEKVGAEIVETKHTKTGEALFVVRLRERVEREVYNQMNAAAKKMGGWYSSYKVGGAIPGFQFKSRETAEAFQKYVTEGDTQTATEVAKERKENRLDEKRTSAVSKLREMAKRLTEKANEELHRDRQTNTARRAHMANNAEDAARKSLRIAETMNNIADAIEAGEVTHLSGLRTKAQIEQLNGMVTIAQYAELRKKYSSYSEQEKHKGEPATIETVDYMRPTLFPDIYADHIRDISRDGLNKEGVKRIAQKWFNRTENKNKEYIKVDNFDDL